MLEGRRVLSASVMTPDFITAGSAMASPDDGISNLVLPTALVHAYDIDQIKFSGGVVGNGTGQTVAIVDAYDDPNIASDLHNFDQYFGLSDPNLLKVSQTGSTTQLPGTDPAGLGNSWAVEISLDVEYVHTIAPGANILLVEANSDYDDDLYAAVQYAANYSGVSVVSMSWGAGEGASETSYDGDFVTPNGHTGITFVAATGDSGSPGGYPADSPNVLAVGGTSLQVSGDNYVYENAWSGSGGGFSSYESEPSYQLGVQNTGARSIPDVSFDADPKTGVAVYDSWDYGSATPWEQIGGTSLAAPCWAGIIAIANQGRSIAGESTLDGASQTLPYLYSLENSFRDITSGSNGDYSAGVGYDEVTGLGTPIANAVVAGLVAGPTNQPPTVNNLDEVIDYSVGSGPTLIAGDAIVVAGANGLASSQLSVSIGSATSSDVLTILAGGGVTVNGSQLFYNGTLIGTFSGGSGTAPLVIQFNASATTAAVQAVVGDVAFSDTSSPATGYDRTASFSLTDSKGNTWAADTETIHVYVQPPTFGNFHSAVNYHAGSGPSLIASGTTVTAGYYGLANSKLTVSLASAGGADVLTILAGNGVTISGSQLFYNSTAIGYFTAGAGSSPLVVQFNASVTQPAVQAVVDDVAFYNTNASPSIFDRTATFTLADSNGNASPLTKTIHFVTSAPLVVITASDAASHNGVSLRDAVKTASIDALNGISDTITFASNLAGQTIILQQGLLELGAQGAGSGVITINGAGAITLSGHGTSELFQIDSGVTASIMGLTLTAGSASYGGAIFNNGTLTLSGTTVSNSTASNYGGGILNNSGAVLTVANSVFSNDSAQYAGAILSFAGATLTISNSTFTSNTATEAAGAIYAQGATTITGSTFSSNSAGDAGGIYLDTSTFTISNSTFSGNSAIDDGGAIDMWQATATLAADTISGNSATYGGGLYNEVTGLLTLVDTIVAGNTVSAADPDVGAAVQSGSSYNLIGNGSGMTGISNGTNGNLVGTSTSPINPLLNALGNYGGTTPTMSLQSGSPAINAGGAVTALATSVTTTATSLSSSVFANFAAIASTSGTYLIQIDSEEILITGYNASNQTVTVVRGYNGTTATAHGAGAGAILPLDQIGDARIGAADIGADEFHGVAATIGNFGGTVNYSAGSQAVTLAGSATVTAGEYGPASAKLTVSVGSAGGADVVTVVAGGGVTISGNTLSYNGTAIGTFTAGAGSSPLVVQFNASVIVADVQAVVDDVAFYNTATSPSIYDRTVSFTLTDNKGNASTPATKTVHFVDNPPTIGSLGGTVNYTAGNGATLLASAATVTAGSLGVSDAKLTVSIGNAGGADVVTVVAGSGITISGSTLSYNGTAVATFSAGAGSSPLVVQFYASATVPAVQAVIDQVAFYNTNASPT
ncbi:MAG TPA: choice-of-anchor Q domain-containing protein, partial [Pirellulales bacterium]|nr:choice-of-anchor Q domain-containing protein [Pirellulales bacterium]